MLLITVSFVKIFWKLLTTSILVYGWYLSTEINEQQNEAN